MAKARFNELLRQNLGSEYMILDPNEIDMSDALGMDNAGFWNHHANTKDDYNELMGKLNRVYEELESGKSLDELMSWENPDNETRDAANKFFTENNAVTVERSEDGIIHFGGDGRHRIMMAQELDMPIPVRMTYDELAEDQGELNDPEDLNTYQTMDSSEDELGIDDSMQDEQQGEQYDEEDLNSYHVSQDTDISRTPSDYSESAENIANTDYTEDAGEEMSAEL